MRLPLFRTAVLLCLAATAAGCTPTETLDADYVIRNVTVIDGTGAAPLVEQTVAIQGDSILLIGPTRRFETTDSTIVIDGTGKFLIPGLWDMHSHAYGYEQYAFPLFLANGVTGVRDMSSDLAISLWLRESVREGRLTGPEFLITGPTLDAQYLLRAIQGTPYAEAREAVDDTAYAVAMVDSLARVKIDAIKVHSLTPRVAYFTILAAAKRHGIPVVGHVPESVSVREAIEAGQRTIEHNTRVELAMTPRGEELSNWALQLSQRFFDRHRALPILGPLFGLRLAVADSALAAYDSATADAFGRFAAERPVWFDPTLVVMETVFRANDSAFRNPPELKYAPAAALTMDEGIPTGAQATPAQLEAGRARLTRHLSTIPPLIRNGVKLITGTDVPVVPLVPGFSLHRELELLVQAGLTPMQAIQAATRNSAEAAQRLTTLGTVEPGKRASLVLLGADPLADISNVKRIDAVFLNGRFFDRVALDAMLDSALSYAQSTRRREVAVVPR